jgi:GAF domain-containing protein
LADEGSSRGHPAERRSTFRRKQDLRTLQRVEKLEQNLSALQVICDLATTLSQAESSEAFCEAALVSLYHALKAERSSILLFDADGCMRFKAWRGLSDSYRKNVEGHSPWTPNDSHAKPILIPDVMEEPLGPLQGVILEEGIRSVGFFPLLSNGKVLGKFMVYFQEPHRFFDSEVHLAQTIAYHISFALERKRNENDLREAFQALARAKTELEEKVSELESFEEVAVGRELKMIALERELAQLKNRLV